MSDEKPEAPAEVVPEALGREALDVTIKGFTDQQKAMGVLPDPSRAEAFVRPIVETAIKKQEELAARADLHRNYVGSVERGEREIGITALGQLVRALDMSLADFFAPFRQRSRRE